MRAFAAERRADQTAARTHHAASRSMQIAFRISLMRAQPIFQLSTHFGSDSLFICRREMLISACSVCNVERSVL
jgi:hypothetical protein